ncbi:MAG TPA: FTR1 family protein [Anaerolineales bacterium]|nr:FTR1 family protein [Anaerolineales bacterium]
MLPAYLLALREGLEAALVIGLTFGVLNRMRRADLRRQVWLGAGMAAVMSAGAAVSLQAIGVRLEGRFEQVFEGLTMLTAAGLLTWMILWMRSQARRLQEGLEDEVRRAAQAGTARAVFTLAMLAVLREGVELALFLTATTYQTNAAATWTGGLLGLATALALGWIVYGTSVRLDMRAFFQATGLLLLLFAAGLVAHSVHEFNELGWIPPILDPIWNLSGILQEDSVVGSLLKSLFGYNANPSLTEALAYVVYLATLVFTWRGTRPPAPVLQAHT